MTQRQELRFVDAEGFRAVEVQLRRLLEAETLAAGAPLLSEASREGLWNWAREHGAAGAVTVGVSFTDGSPLVRPQVGPWTVMSARTVLGEGGAPDALLKVGSLRPAVAQMAFTVEEHARLQTWEGWDSTLRMLGEAYGRTARAQLVQLQQEALARVEHAVWWRTTGLALLLALLLNGGVWLVQGGPPWMPLLGTLCAPAALMALRAAEGRWGPRLRPAHLLAALERDPDSARRLAPHSDRVALLSEYRAWQRRRA